MAVHDMPKRLRAAAALLVQAADEIERLHRERPIDHPERLPVALEYLRRHPESMLYRGDKTETWMLQGSDAPPVRFDRGEIETAVAQGLLVPNWPDDPRIGIDCLHAAPSGASRTAKPQP